MRAAIAAAEVTSEADTIQIADGTYSIDPAEGSFDLGDTPGVTFDDLSFVGNVNPTAVILDGDSQSRVFDIFGGDDSYNVSFEGLTIRNGVANDFSGGAGINAGFDVNLTLENVILESNEALNGASGGAVQASGNLTINNSVINGNGSDRHGGGIDYFSFDDSKSFSISNSSVLNNTATLFGGGIYVDGEQTSVVIDTVTFTNNEGPDSGGGVFSDGATLTVSDSSFRDNRATLAQSGGGGLYLLGVPDTGDFSVSNTDFENNEAVDGAGGLEVVNVSGTISGGLFTQNQVTGTGNSFDQGGGAIVVIGPVSDDAGPVPVLIESVTVQENTAPAAGGIALVDANVTISNSVIQDNIATNPLIGGGGIGAIGSVEQKMVAIRHSQILGNTTAAEGGGIGAVDILLNIDSTTINGNEASGGRAGGIGIIDNTGPPALLEIQRSTISNNTAQTGGGGLGIDTAEAFLENVTVSGNVSLDGNGGGILLTGSPSTYATSILYSTIVNNEAVSATNLFADFAQPVSSDARIEASIFDQGTCGGAALFRAGDFVFESNIDSGNTCNFDIADNLINTDPQIGPLANNGGPVQTHALIASSPAIDASTIPLDASAINEFVTSDARTFFRPVDGDGNDTAVPDIGAFEASSEPRLLIEDLVVDEAVGNVNVFVRLDANVATPFTVEYSTIDDTAIDEDIGVSGDSDFESQSGTLSFTGDENEVQTISLTINDDDVVEDIEQFAIELFNVAPNTLTINTSDIGTINIIDDDTASVSVMGVSVSEDESEIEVEVTFNGDTQDSVEVLLQTIDGFGAESDIDFSSIFESVVFDGFDGEVQSVFIPILPDDVVELDEELLISSEFGSPDRRNITFEDFADFIFFDQEGVFSDTGFVPNDIEVFTPNSSTTIAYVADQDGLRILDFSDAQSAIQLGSFPLIGGIQEINAVSSGQFDGLLFVAAGESGLVVLDVSDPSNISQVGSFASFNQEAVSIAKMGDTVFLGERHAVNLISGGMRILDVSNPSSITQLGRYSGFASVDDIAIEGSTAYLAVPDTPGNLQIVDVTDLTTPTFLGTFANREATAVAIDGTTAYLGTPTGVAKLDVSDPNNVIERSFFSTQAAVTEIINNGSILSVGDADGVFRILDASQFNFIRSLGALGIGSDPIGGIANDGFNYFLTSETVGISAVEAVLLDDEFTFILNDDSATLSINDASELEDNGALTFTITLTGQVDAAFSVDVATMDIPGQAAAGDDYVADSDLLFFEGVNNETETFTISLQPDADMEPDETFAVDILDVFADGRSIDIESPGRGIGTILNDDFAAGADLQIVKSDDADPVIPGDLLTYTLIVTNKGPDVATDVVVTDRLPPALSFQAGDVEGDDSAVTTNGNDVTAIVGTLGVNQTSTITLLTLVAETAAGDFANSATVLGGEPDGDTTNNTATETTTVTVLLNEDDQTIDEDFDSISLDVLSNDLPLGGLTITNVTSVSLGVATIIGGTEISYLPDPNAFGQDVFSYTATNAFGETSSAEITITIQPLNDPPEATDDSFDASDQVSPLILEVADLLSNDSPGPNEASTQTLALTDVDALSANGGTVSLLGSAITYTPPVGFTGLIDTFQYEISDDASPSLSALGTVTINFPPPPATLQGHIYCDADGNGGEDLGEAVVGTLVFLDENGNRQLDVGERSTLTDANGDYAFANITDATLTVVAEVPSGCLSIPSNPGISRSQFGIEDLAHSLAATDFDRDGDVDLVVVGDLVNDQATFLENTDGVFDILGATPLGSRPRSIASWESGSVQVTAVAGVGTPQDLGNVFLMAGDTVIDTHQAGDGPVDVALADFDGNNEPDIVVAALRSSDVHVIINGVLQPDPVGEARLARAVEAGDVNGDGNDDIVIGGFSYPEDEFSQLAVLLGDGFGGFSEPLLADPIREVVDLGIAPLRENSDDNVIWALSGEGTLSVYFIDDGLLELVSATDVTDGATAFDVGDFNRDGSTDVAIASLGNQLIEISIGNGDGQFALITSLSDVSAPSDLVVADFDKDGADDVAVTNLYQDLNLGSSDVPEFKLPSQVTVLLVDVAEDAVTISAGAVGQVDFEFQNADPEIRFDVSGDGRVTALDALRVLNRLQEIQPEGEFVFTREATDVNGDGNTTALDALLVINELSRQHQTDSVVELLSDDDNDDEERVAAVDVIFGQLV
ncbi:MAG: Calx-beta domain-containing protein [Planctomycetota bacterium]